MKKNLRVEFASDEKIDEFAYELIERVFEIEGALLTDESTLDDFKPIDYIPGHWQRRLSDIPESERAPYLKEIPDFVELERYICWYPPVTDAEWTEIHKTNRQRLISLVEKAYGISLADFPEEELYVWKVATSVKRKLLSR
ncbi:TPA: hypothetical protein EYP66_26145 [Candidatus Poribacteria bacterium]|nr:hypothetical protein [Candidatus Poribacteria bacterium]